MSFAPKMREFSRPPNGIRYLSEAVPTLVNAPRQRVRSSVSGVWECPVNATAFGNALSAAVEFPESCPQTHGAEHVAFGW